MPYIFVRAMQNDGVDLSIFEPEQYLEPAARPLMAKVTVEPDDECDAVHPQGVMLKLDAVATDGRTESFSIRDPKGFWTNPMSQEEVKAKFLGLVEPVYGAETAGQLYDYWSEVAGKQDLTEGMNLFGDKADTR
jgi:2-methylcitrate dehydratase PrpD